MTLVGLQIRPEFLIPNDLRHILVVECHRHPTLQNCLIPADPQVVDVIPTVFMKWVVNHRCAKQESNLAVCHADFELINIFLIEQVALRERCLVDAAAGKQQCSHNQ